MTSVTGPEYPKRSDRFDWIAAGLSAWVIGGLYLDGWAHSHGKVDDVFFTPWHAILYSGVLALFIFLFLNQARNVSQGYSLRRALPPGYFLSLIGIAFFLLGGALDFLWHTLFGVEVDIEALLSPTHLLLATSGVLMVSGPIRSAWSRPSPAEARGWRALGPLVLSTMLLLSILTFFTQFAHPIGHPLIKNSTALDHGRVSDLYLMNADGTGQKRLTANAMLDSWGGAWSPDSHQIVFTQSEAQNGDKTESALYLMSVEGDEAKQLTDLPGQEYLPTWSPDGTRIAFVSQVEHKQTIYVINVDGSQLQQLTEATSSAFGPSWSPDATQIVYTSNASGRYQLHRLELDNHQTTQLTSNSTQHGGATWSPTGNPIAFHSTSAGNSDIYLINQDGSGEQRLTESPADDFSPSWSPDGQQLTFVSWGNGTSDIYVINKDGSSPRNLTHNHALELSQPEWSPDGKTILFSANGHLMVSNTYETKSLAIASFLLQAAILMGMALMLVKHWTLPFGALTLMFTLNGLLMSVFYDDYVFALPLLGAGLIADSLLAWSKPSTERRERFWLLAFSVPALFCAFYFLAVQLTQGIDWAIHLWLGTIFMTGIIGLLVGFLIESPWSAARKL